MLAFLLWRRTSLRITFGEFWRISILSFIYIICAITLFVSYSYISSGVATSLIYTNPVWCAVIGVLFCHEKVTPRVVASMVTAIVGVMLLTGFFSSSSVFSAWGVFLGLCSGIGYGIYLILLPRLRLSNVSSLKLTYYIFFNALIFITIFLFIFEGGIQYVNDSSSWVNLILVGLLPTAFSNICVTMALRLIDTTVVAILGAFEPFTAMIIGIIVFHEDCGVPVVVGGLLVVLSVLLLTVRNNNTHEAPSDKVEC